MFLKVRTKNNKTLISGRGYSQGPGKILRKEAKLTKGTFLVEKKTLLTNEFFGVIEKNFIRKFSEAQKNFVTCEIWLRWFIFLAR